MKFVPKSLGEKQTCLTHFDAKVEYDICYKVFAINLDLLNGR